MELIETGLEAEGMEGDAGDESSGVGRASS